jgi:adenine/guanine phosphoribosyltransferase-like PRPP-binding protein
MLISGNASKAVGIVTNDHLETLRRCGGYYECPKDDKGRRVGPLVGYAGKYDSQDGTKKSYVGEVYYNFAKAEQYPHVLDHFARTLLSTSEMEEKVRVDIFLGAPMGGILFAGALARILDCQVVFAEKKIKKIATLDNREESDLILDRHGIPAKANVIIAEDVCNNFSTTAKLIELVEIKYDAHVMGIACAFNRSPNAFYDCKAFYGYGSRKIAIESLIHIPTLQYMQNDPYVEEQVEAGDVAWKPKDEWKFLEAAVLAAKGA